MTRYGRNIFQDLANFSNSNTNGLSVDRLADKYAGAVESRKRREAANANAFNLNVPHMELVQKRIADQLEAEAAEIHGGLPVSSVYDAHTLVKNSKRRDAGVNALQGQLERMWQRDRTGSITADTYITLYDHYRRNYPKSAAAELIQSVGENGYATLPVSDLTHIASQIKNQDEFDHAIMLHGFNGPLPHQVKARRYILALLNDREEEEAEETSHDHGHDSDDEMEESFVGEMYHHLEEMEDLVEEFSQEEGFEDYEGDEGGESEELPFINKSSQSSGDEDDVEDSDLDADEPADQDDGSYVTSGRSADMFDDAMEGAPVMVDPPGMEEQPTQKIDPPLDNSIAPMLQPYITHQQDDIAALAKAWGSMQPVEPEVVMGAVDKLYTMQGIPEYEGVEVVIEAILAHVEDDKASDMSKAHKRVASFIRRRRTQAMVNKGN